MSRRRSRCPPAGVLSEALRRRTPAQCLVAGLAETGVSCVHRWRGPPLRPQDHVPILPAQRCFAQPRSSERRRSVVDHRRKRGSRPRRRTVGTTHHHVLPAFEGTQRALLSFALVSKACRNVTPAAPLWDTAPYARWPLESRVAACGTSHFPLQARTTRSADCFLAKRTISAAGFPRARTSRTCK